MPSLEVQFQCARERRQFWAIYHILIDVVKQDDNILLDLRMNLQQGLLVGPNGAQAWMGDCKNLRELCKEVCRVV